MRCNLDKTVSWPFVDTFTRCLEKGFTHLHNITKTSKEFQKYNNKFALAGTIGPLNVTYTAQKSYDKVSDHDYKFLLK